VVAEGVVAGRFQLQDKLGAGAFGEAHIALDQTTERRVVLKLIHPQFAENEELVERFRREIRALERVVHPNVPGLVAQGTDAGGRVYYAMEFAAGKDLFKVLEEEPGPWPLKRSLMLFDDLLAALEAAHQAEVIHRDLKPANLILVREQGIERLKLIDFGIAKHLSGGEQTTLDITQGRAVGTPFYLSPEQASGEEVDARSDLFAAGSILYEMLVGVRPVSGSTVRAILTSILRDPPPPLREKRPDVPPALESVVLKLLEKDAPDRYPSAAEVRAALRAAVPEAFKDVSATAVTQLPGHAGLETQSTDPHINTVVAGKYELRKLLGQGGFGRVYQAWHLELEMPVAVKVLSFAASNASDELLAEVHARFRREARAMRAFVHKHTVQVRDFGRDGDVFYLELDYLEGQTLEDAIEAQPFDEERTLKMAGQILSGLAEAHRKGIVHRDLKPANVMLVQEDGEESARILDFGIVKLVGAMEDKTSPGLTGSGVAIGTVQYMSPEQAGGDEVGFASDVYSLGAVLYRCLAGRLPIDAGTARTQASYRARVMTKAPAPLGETAPQVSPRTRDAIMRALSKEEDQRPQDASEFAADLLAGTPYFLGGTAVLPSQTRPEPSSSGGGGPKALAALVLLLLIAVGVVAGVPELRAKALAALGAATPTPGASPNSTPNPSASAGSSPTPLPSGTPPPTPPRPVATPSPIASPQPSQTPQVAYALHWKTPRAGATELSSPITLSGTVEGPLEDAELVLIADGTELKHHPLDAAGFSFEANVSEGTHDLELVFKSQGVVRKSLARRLNVAPEHDVPPWWREVAEDQRPDLPLPRGLSFGTARGTYLNDADGSEMVFVPGGDLLMGEEGRRTHVEDFFIGRYEVTRAQYSKQMKTGEFPRGQGKLPQTEISWNQAQAYCEAAGLRLPTEAEWERAARGPKSATWPWGEATPTHGLLNAALDGKTPPGLAAVGSFKGGRSPFGAYDMCGNASEWVADWRDAAQDRRLFKGGSYKVPAKFCLPTKRGGGFPPDYAKRSELGFRVARAAH
jgi:serine/threonine protein kinase/formylglycine-generating enzyme required for sulfatase activity